MFGRVVLVSVFVLILAQAGLASDYYATPTGAGAQNGTSWSNAYSQSQLENVLDSSMLPGDVLHLGSGTYSQQIHLDSSGTATSPKRIVGEDTGGGLPVMDMGTWSRTDPDAGPAWAIRFGNAASYWILEKLVIQDVQIGIRVDNLTTTSQYIGITLRNLTIRNCRYPIAISDAKEWLIENITATQYTKYGFRLDHNCQDITLRNCTADLSGGDASWYTYAEVYPFGFIVDDPTQNDGTFGGGPASSNITFENCLAQHHRMLESRQTEADPYWNGDGFVINSGGNGNTGLFEFVGCRAIDNEDGGFDIKASSTLIDCVAFQNSRNFRFWNGNTTLTNCVSGYPTKRGGSNGLAGVWVNNPTVTMDFCTLHALGDRGVSEEGSTGQVTLTNSIISFELTTGTPGVGNVTLGSGTVTYEPGAGDDPHYVNPHAGWDGVGTDMNSNRYGDSKGYFHDPNSGDPDHQIVLAHTAPTIDGSVDSVWTSANSQVFSNIIFGSVTDGNDLSGSFRTMWDATNLYVLVEVTDNAQQNDSGLLTWHDDSMEIYIDANNDKASSYGLNDHQYRFTWTGSLLRIEETKHDAVLGVTASWVDTTAGYTIEVMLPWNTLGQSSAAFGALLGLDVHVNDDDDGGNRDGKKAWFNTADTSWQNPSTFATARLQANHEVVQTTTAPSIDGNVESAWNSANSQIINNIVVGSVTDNTDLSGSFRTMWDSNNLYVLVQVTDEAQQNDSGAQTWNDDSVEIYIDANNDKPSSYGSNDYRYHFTWTGSSLRIDELEHNAIAGVTASRVATANGYVIEVRLPWSTLSQTSVAINALLGLDVHISDDDNGGSRDGKKAWFNTVDTSWQSPGTFATARLTGSN